MHFSSSGRVISRIGEREREGGRSERERERYYSSAKEENLVVPLHVPGCIYTFPHPSSVPAATRSSPGGGPSWNAAFLCFPEGSLTQSARGVWATLLLSVKNKTYYEKCNWSHGLLTG